MKRIVHARALFLTAGLVACGNPLPSSSPSGHYEDATERKMTAYVGQQHAVPEHNATKGVVVSLPILTNYGREDMLVEILKSHIEVLWITVSKNQNITLNSPELAQLKHLAGPLFSKVKLVVQKTSGPISVWARDWSPLGSLTAENQPRLLDFNYYSSRPADDGTAQSMGNLYGYDRVSVPVYNEGGNFMNNNLGDCLMTSRVIDANDHGEVTGDLVLTPDEIKGYYRDFAGCQKVTILPRMPYEGTGHIDMWAKFLDDKTLLVSELRDDTVALYDNAEPRKKQAVHAIADFLKARAKDLAGLGYTLVKIPLPAPEFSYYGSVVRSYTNSLIVNGRAIVPQYVRSASTDDGRYPDQDRLTAMEEEVRAAYKAAGYELAFIPADELIENGGAVHCTTMQIGAPE